MKKMMVVAGLALALGGCGPTRSDSAFTGAAFGGALAGAAIGAASGAVIGASAAPRRCWDDPYYGPVCER